MQQKLFNKLKWSFTFIWLGSIGFGCGDKGVVLPQTLPPGFVLIKAGSFMMGSPNGVGYNDEYPQHKVTLSAFYLDTAELTRKKFLPFLKSRDTSYLDTYQKKEEDYRTGWMESEAHPIVNVSWKTAVVYCNWLTKQTSPKDTCYTFTFKVDGSINTITFDRAKKGYRLPSEAEWEYACRAGTKTDYSFGDGSGSLGIYAWYAGNSGGTTHIVGGKKANIFGLYDMHGNVREWCWDWYNDKYSDMDQVDPVGPQNGISRVNRGGSWDVAEKSLRSAYRSSNDATFPGTAIGFRLAKTM